jgi:hypothetical protein
MVAYDPMAKELVIDPENGLEPLVIQAVDLHVKLWGDGGILSCLVGELTLDVAFVPIDEEPAQLRVDAMGPNRWLVRFEAISGGESS